MASEWLRVEEAAAHLGIGRTKAYALTREWRATAGRSGLPVVDFGDVLRVPRKALDQLAADPASWLRRGVEPVIDITEPKPTTSTRTKRTKPTRRPGNHHPTSHQHQLPLT